MCPLFFNGPVQNGSFTFHSQPGKAVGIRTAAALNAILGAPAVPHLWNTVTLTGDLRHRQHASQRQISREELETDLIAAKYPPGPPPPAGIITDADGTVSDLALKIIEDRLQAGTLTISRETVRTCRRCGHMTGSGHHSCNACGGGDTRAGTSLHLVAEQAMDRLVLDRSDIHASHRRYPQHLQNTAANVPPRLLLSRTRAHGIDLSSLGLPGLVLDPRVGLHIAVLAAAQRFQTDLAVMTITENAATHIAAYGHLFREHNGTRLRYTLHGRIPYDHLARLECVYAAYHTSTATRAAFETWFLPLVSWKEKNAIRPEQLPALFKHFMRARTARPTEPDERITQNVRHAVASGRTDWIMDRIKLANAMIVDNCRTLGRTPTHGRHADDQRQHDRGRDR